MARGKTDLTSYEYDDFLASKKHSRSAWKEVKERHRQRQNKGYEGWHFGIDDKPVKCRSKEEFKRELAKRNLMMRDDVRKELR